MPIEKIIILNLDDTTIEFDSNNYSNLHGGSTAIGFSICYGDNFEMIIHPATVKSISVWYKK